MTTEKMEAWLDTRGLDIELAVRMGWDVGQGRDGVEWLKIPYFRSGKKINDKFRCLTEKRFLNTPGAEHDLWNVDVLKDATLSNYPIFLTEGELDALSMIQAGFVKTVSIPDGWTDKIEDYDGQPKFKILEKNEKLFKGQKIVVAGDDDPTGWAFVRAVSNFFEDEDVCSVSWPDDCKDANDCLRLHGADELVRRVNGAKPIDPAGGVITGFSDLPVQPPRTVWKLGLPDFERSMAFRSREISVFTGMPGIGKTTFAVWCVHHLVRHEDLRIGAILMESDYESEMLEQLCVMRGHGQGLDEKRQLDRNFRLVTLTEADDVGHGMLWLKKFIHKLAARDGCNVIIIDPWNELEHLPEPGESMTNYINFALKKLRQWAAKYDVHIMIVAHPRKLHAGEKPGGYSVADSAAFFNKPGMGWSLYYDETEDHGKHIVLDTWKVRNRRQTGCCPGVLRIDFDEAKMVYRRMVKIDGKPAGVTE